MQNGAILGNTYGYMCLDTGNMHQLEDRITYFETNGYLNRDAGEASQKFFLKKIALVSPTIAKY